MGRSDCAKFARLARWKRALNDVLLIAGCLLMLPVAIVLTLCILYYVFGGQWPWAL